MILILTSKVKLQAYFKTLKNKEFLILNTINLLLGEIVVFPSKQYLSSLIKGLSLISKDSNISLSPFVQE